MKGPTILLCALTVAIEACGDPGSSGSSGSGGRPGGGGSGAGGAAEANVDGGAAGSPAPRQGGSDHWMKSFTANPPGVTCETSFADMQASGAASLTFGNTTIFVAFQQFSMNQDPVFFRFDGGTKTYCEHHESEAPDGRAYGITWDGGDTAYVVYTIVGGGSAFDQKAQGGWTTSYGDGGASSKVAVIASVETQFGTVTHATFVPAKIVKSGQTKTNSLMPADAADVLASGAIQFWGKSAWSPLNPDHSLMCGGSDVYPGALNGSDGPNYLAQFSADLTTMLCSTTKSCSNVLHPCQ